MGELQYAQTSGARHIFFYTLNFNEKKILSPGLENNHTLKFCSGIYVKIVGKIPYQYLSV